MPTPRQRNHIVIDVSLILKARLRSEALKANETISEYVRSVLQSHLAHLDGISPTAAPPPNRRPAPPAPKQNLEAPRYVQDDPAFPPF